MYLTGMTQRDRLFDVEKRWLSDRPQADDGRFVTQLFLFESLISGPTTRRFLGDVLGAVHARPFTWRRFRSKDELRDALSSCCPRTDPQAAELMLRYEAFPEDFYPHTPVELLYATRADGCPAGMVRIKRIKRIAEKASRRLADRLADEIERAASGLAERRALAAGVALAKLVSPPDVMTEEFLRAEQYIAHMFRDHEIALDTADMRVDDVIGFKIVGNESELQRAEQVIRAHPAVRGVLREEHRGKYNDVNLIVDLELDPPAQIIEALRDFDWSPYEGRGLAAAELKRSLPDYVESGARTIRAEVILTTLPELIESEFGRSIHERRILEQRRGGRYQGRIAQNASFLIEYLLTLAVSPTIRIDEVPIKLWGRYLPDVFALATWQLFGFDGNVESAGIAIDETTY